MVSGGPKLDYLFQRRDDYHEIVAFFDIVPNQNMFSYPWQIWSWRDQSAHTFWSGRVFLLSRFVIIATRKGNKWRQTQIDNLSSSARLRGGGNLHVFVLGGFFNCCDFQNNLGLQIDFLVPFIRSLWLPSSLFGFFACGWWYHDYFSLVTTLECQPNGILTRVCVFVNK